MLSKLTIAQRIWLIAILSLATFSSTFLFQIVQKRDALLASKQEKLVSVVETATGEELVVTGGDVVTGHDLGTGEELWRMDGCGNGDAPHQARAGR